jgi:hypothetical protein
MRQAWRRSKPWLLTAVIVVAPLGGVALILYGLAKLAVKKRLVRPLDPYAEWLALREQLRNRHAQEAQGNGEPRRDVGGYSPLSR